MPLPIPPSRNALRAAIACLLVVATVPVSTLLPPGAPLASARGGQLPTGQVVPILLSPGAPLASARGGQLPAGQAAANSFVVNDTGDAADETPGDGVCDAGGGVCTLRAAIEEANASPGADSITFGSACSAACTIIPGSGGLPEIREAVTITGPLNGSNPRVTLSGVVAGGGANGLTVIGGGTTITGLAITGFGNGILLSGGAGNVVRGNYIGLTSDGSAAAPNLSAGIGVVGASDNTIGGSGSGRNVISGNAGPGVSILGTGGSTSRNAITNNLIGLGPDGETRWPNNLGVLITDSSENSVEGNTIAGNFGDSIGITGLAGAVGVSESNLIRDNRIGTNEAGTAARSLDRNSMGIRVNGSNGPARSTTITANTIAGNELDGVFITGVNATQNVVSSNTIGKNGVANLRHGVNVSTSASNNSINSNTITHNGGNGINIAGSAGSGNTCAGNNVANNVTDQIAGCTDDGTPPPPDNTPSPVTSTFTVDAPGAVIADGTTAWTATVTVKNSAGSPLSGVSVTLTSSRNGATAVDGINPPSATTTAGGVATFTVTSTAAGTAALTAAASSVTLTPTRDITFTAGAVSGTQSTVSASPGSVQIGGPGATVTVTLRDAHGNPVSGRTVTLVSNRGGDDTIGPASGPSTSDGAVTFAVNSTVGGKAVFSATGDGVAITPTSGVFYFTPGSRTLSFIGQPPDSTLVPGGHIAAGFAFASAVRVQDLDGPVVDDDGTEVTLELMSPAGVSGAVLSCTSAGGLVATMNNGVAVFTGCSISARGDGFRLRATAPGIAMGESAVFNVRLAGDADNTCGNPANAGEQGVDVVDFSLLLKGFGLHSGNPGFDPNVDFDGSGATDIVDFSMLLSQFGSRC